MRLNRRRSSLALLALLALCAAGAQEPESFVSTGTVERDGRVVAYEVRHLPVSSFRELPFTVSAQLTDLGCVIPQTYEAKRPENVVHASLEEAGSSDWAVLCSRGGEVSLLVFFGSGQGRYMQLAGMAETERLQNHLGSAVMGFNWGIDPASPVAVRQAQTGLRPRPSRIEHDAIADSVIDGKVLYRYFARGAWSVLDVSE